MQVREFAKKIVSAVGNKDAGSALEVVRTATVNRLQRYVFDPYFKNNEAVDTQGIVDLNSLTIQSENRDQGWSYEASPRQLIHILSQVLPQDHANWTFIDIGAGRGRVLLEAAMYPYREVLGIEFASELVEEGKLNIASSASDQHKAKLIALLQADATRFVVPHGPCIFYLFNPFEEDVTRAFLRNVLSSYDVEPREFVFVYLNPTCASVFEEFPKLQLQKLPRRTRLKLSVMVPSKLNIYRLSPLD